MTWYVIDGMDGSGKSTAGTMLKSELESFGRYVLEVTHPNEQRILGRITDRFLRFPGGKFWELLATIFYIFDVLMSLIHVRRHGSMYDDIIFIRYSMAVAYVPKRMVRNTYRIVESILPVPDVKVFVDIEPQVALDRINSRGESLEVFETYERLSKVRGKMKMISHDWYIIDNSGSNQELRDQIRRLLSLRSNNEGSN